MMGRQSAALASTNHAIMCASIGTAGHPRSKIVGKRRAQRESHRATVRAVCRTLGIYPVTPMLARMLAWDRRSIGQIFAAAGVSRLPRPVCESMGERWRDGVSCLQTYLNEHLHEQTVRDSPRRAVSIDGFGGLPVNFEHAPHPFHTPSMHASRSCTSTT